MVRNKSKDGSVGARGFRLVRVTASTSYDPCAGIDWQPPRESDELFEALKKAFPERKTHRERMCEALVEFLAAELNGSAEPVAVSKDSVPAGDGQGTEASQSYQMSKKPLFRTHVFNSDSSLITPVPIARSKANGTTKMGPPPTNEDIPKKSKEWEDMTVVWKSNIGLTKGARPRRMMTEEERTDYRMRRVRGACVSCKRKKRKCNHDVHPSPSTSLETMETSPEINEATESPSDSLPQIPSPQRLRERSVRFASESMPEQPSMPQNHNLNGSVVANTGPENNSTIPHLTFTMQSPFDTSNPSTETIKHDASLYQPASLSADENQYCWDLSAHELHALHKQRHSLHPEPIDFTGFPTLEFSGVPDHSNTSGFLWDIGLPTANSWFASLGSEMQTTTASLLPSDTQSAGPAHNISHPSFTQFSFPPLDHHLSYDHFLPAQAPGAAPPERDRNGCPSQPELKPGAALEELENHWAHIQGQQHVEQWLEHKSIEEHSAPRNPELNPSEDEDGEVANASPQKRRVKFDFSTLIDGPPTLSTPPAELLKDEPLGYAGKHDEPVPRPPRSASRHSTGSRMSFSDIISLSSALTSLSVKDGESRRGSVHSGSERNMDEGSEDEDDDDDDDESDDEFMKNRDEMDSASGPMLDSDEEDDHDTDKWMQWLADNKKLTLEAKDGFLSRCVKIKMQQRQKSE